MKRKLSEVFEGTSATELSKLKKEHFLTTHKQPSSYRTDAPVLRESTAFTIHRIWENNHQCESGMDVDIASSGDYMFLFLLDAQGKDQIALIRDMILEFSQIAGLFVSSNIEYTDHEGSPSVSFSNTEQCKSLSKDLGLLDPLGGGSYPLNYLMIIDSDMRVRYEVPLRFSHCYGAYQKFGLHLPQLHGLIEEYSKFAATP